MNLSSYLITYLPFSRPVFHFFGGGGGGGGGFLLLVLALIK